LLDYEETKVVEEGDWSRRELWMVPVNQPILTGGGRRGMRKKVAGERPR
jgi:hypothetical protein